MLRVVGADRYGVDVLPRDQLVAAFVGVGVLPAEFVQKGARLAGDDIRTQKAEE